MPEKIIRIKTTKLAWISILAIFLIVLLLISVLNTMSSNRALKGLKYHKKELAVRGSIKSSDNEKGFTIAKSILFYKAIIDTRYLDPNKKDLFVALFSIYSGIKKEVIYKKLNNQKRLGKLTLSYGISKLTASRLNQLSKIVNYTEHKDENNITRPIKIFRALNQNQSFYSGLDIVESGDKRLNPYKDTMTPLIGYVSKNETKNGITRLTGLKGLEKYYDKELNNYKSGLVTGDRDAVGYAILNKYCTFKTAKNGNNLHLNISLKLQRNIEMILDRYKTKFEAREIIVSVMDSKTGKVLLLGTSNRFNPQRIKQNEVGYLNVNAVEMKFEPGSIIKPITMALVFDKYRVKKGELINAHNKGKRNKKGLYPRGRYRLKPHTIGDDHRFNKRYITPSDIIVYSSNIGILQLAQRLSGQEFLDGFHKFGFARKTGIDVSYEKKGLLHTLKQYRAYENTQRDNIYKATDSYGQGITATFMQVLKAYSVFNNDGKIVTPQIVSHITNSDDKLIKRILPKKAVQIVSSKSANIVKQMLIRTVTKGTGKGADIKGLEIGGKTGTAQIPRRGKYQKEYISSFFGFANDRKNKYTIGVTVFEPSYKYHYASQSAVVVFRDVIDILMKQGYLELSG